jgi:hypothetical protein
MTVMNYYIVQRIHSRGFGLKLDVWTDGPCSVTQLNLPLCLILPALQVLPTGAIPKT